MSTENQPGRGPVVEELTVLGRKLGDAFRAVMASPQRYEVETELREGFQTVVNELNEAMGKVRSTDVAKDLGDQAAKAMDSVRSSKVTQEVRDGLLSAIRSLNDELDQFTTRVRQADGDDAPAAEEPKQTEPPAA